MTLWRVDVSGVSHRYVEAETQAEAVEQVEQSLIRAMDVQATLADPKLSKIYEYSGPIQRKNMLARIDGLTNPKERRESKAAKRQLERMIAREQELQEWVAKVVAGAPPISPETADKIATLLEVRHVEANFTRLPEWDRRSPVHGQ